MIREGNLVEVVMRVVRVERGKPTVATLHADEPVQCTIEPPLVSLLTRAAHGPGDDGGIVQIGIVGIRELKSPAAARQSRSLDAPVSRLVQELLRAQPRERALGGRN